MNQSEDNAFTEADFLYDKEVVCPLCEKKIKVRVVKRSGLRLIRRDSDSLPYYKYINPLFYDVWVCNHCGYASLESTFLNDLKKSEQDLIYQKVSSHWQYREYPSTMPLEMALDRYKIALYCSEIRNAKENEMSMLLLKLAWLHRLKGNSELEKRCLGKAVAAFKVLYEKGNFPVAGMNESALVYMLADLNNRIDEDKECLMWLGILLNDRQATPALKEKARDLKYLISEEKKKAG
ncbi:MAG: DUF2225 domain-containing protein [Syntrophomonadaceae bacterium]